MPADVGSRGNDRGFPWLGVSSKIFVQNVTSGLVPLFHLPEWNDGGCFGSNNVCRSLLEHQPASQSLFVFESGYPQFS